MNESWEVIVIGGGPAGLSAALLLGRARRRVLVVDAGSPRNRFAAHMHGVLGNEGAEPAALLARGREEVARYGVEVRDGRVTEVQEQDRAVVVSLDDGTELTARALVVATGITDSLPGVPGLAGRWGTTVLHCPYCHGWEVRDRRLGVLVTSAMDLHRAQLVRQWSEDVVVFAGGVSDGMASDGAASDAGLLTPELEARLRARGVEIVTSPVVEVLGDDGAGRGAGGAGGDSAAMSGVRTADGVVVPVDAIFAGGESVPHDAFLAPLGLARSETPMGNFLDVDQTGRTSSARIWAAGNVVNPGLTVPMSIGAGAQTGGAVNMALVTEDFDLAEGAAPAPTAAATATATTEGTAR
ncbi:NAD(P)/FAD-dependent oxidoreductase [Myceligenerans crystallogenes]|uniref:NAD(P)/FAD-dependent oxidoreductase n=1 Tax=Myceligenerans crystallogenes TaxID=316335 RepID=A0ABN2N8D4_9MICO